MSARGGARPGAGRPPGSGKGRTAGAVLNLRISEARKARLQAHCYRSNTTLTAAISEWIDGLDYSEYAVRVQQARRVLHR